MTKKKSLFFILSLICIILLFNGCGSKKKEAIEFYNKALNARNYKIAAQHLYEAIRIYPDYAEAYYQLGYIDNRISMGPTSYGVEYLLKAIEINPQYLEAYYELGWALKHNAWSLEMYDKEEFLRKVLNYKGGFGRDRLIWALFNKTLELNPKHIPSYYELADYNLHNQDYTDDEGNSYYLMKNGLTIRKKRAYENALSCYEKIIEIDENQSKAYYYSAEIYLDVLYLRAIGKDTPAGKREAYEKALAISEKQIEINPNGKFASSTYMNIKRIKYFLFID